MALDEAMLDAVAEDASFATMRTYGWAEPTLSLGYFQRITDAEGDIRWRGSAIVRRPTGGGAIWHHHELTYAIVLPASHPLAHRRVELYREVHRAIADLLRSRGLEAERRGDSSVRGRANRPFLCFSDADPEDVVYRGVKIVGSSQRRRSEAILQHGSLLLERSPTTPELAGAGDLADVPHEPSSWSEGLEERLTAPWDSSLAGKSSPSRSGGEVLIWNGPFTGPTPGIGSDEAGMSLSLPIGSSFSTLRADCICWLFSCEGWRAPLEL